MRKRSCLYYNEGVKDKNSFAEYLEAFLITDREAGAEQPRSALLSQAEKRKESDMKKTLKNRMILVWALVVTLLMAAAPALAEEYAASTIRLERYEGDLQIEDANGKPRFFMEGVRLASGDVMTTGTASAASVSLDATKILTMDQESQVNSPRRETP